MGKTTDMFYGATPAIFEKAKRLRENMTRHEKLLWNELKGNKILKYRFKPQHPIDVYIADFYCHQLKLVIEIDGENHREKRQADYDVGRTAELENFGIKVLRFENQEVDSAMDNVINKIENFCLSRKKELEENIINSTL